MGSDPDEEALSWSGETDPTHVASRAPKPTPVLVGGAAVTPQNPVLLIVFGILAGIYLLYAIGWGIHAFTHPTLAAGVFPVIMFQLGEFLSIVSPILWAGAVWLLTKKAGWRLLWLFVGALILAPIPFIAGW